VNEHFSTRRAQRRLSWALVIALVPMVTFMGHWPTSVPLPGTNLYIVLPFAAPSTGTGSGDHQHEQHCHGNAAGCSDTPTAAGVSVGLVNQELALPVAAGAFIALAFALWLPASWRTDQPELQPPRFLLPA